MEVLMNSINIKTETSFKYLNTTQFLGALNDNLFKLLLVFFLTANLSEQQVAKVTSLSLAIFVLPFLLFLPLAGNLADRYSKRNIIACTKLAEVVIMAGGLVAFWLQSPIALYCVLFVMAAQSAFFGPCKYGIVPELVEKENLSNANGKLEAVTYLAIVLGIAAAPFILEFTSNNYPLMGLICVTLAVIGLIASLKIQKTPRAGGTSKSSIIFVKDVAYTIWSIHRKKDLLLAVLASAYFLLVAAFIQTNLITYGKSVLGFTSVQSGYLFVIAAVGIGLGAFIAGKLSGRYVEFGIVPIGAIGLTVCSLAMAMAKARYVAFSWTFLTGLSAGLFIVPLHAFIQLKSPTQRRGKIVAASSFLGWVGVLIASGIIFTLTSFGFSTQQLFVVLALLTLALSIVTVTILPDFLVRFIVLLITRLVYRIKTSGLENIATQTGALIVCNHTSYVDALLLGATQQRRIRFMMYRGIYENKWLNPFFRLMGVIPISQDDPPKQIIASIRQARQAMDDGFLVCIFPEGMITRTGMLGRFKPGFEKIMKGTNYPIIPAYIGGTWGSIFSYSNGKVFSSFPKKLPYPVSIYFGKQMPPFSNAVALRQKISELSAQYHLDKKSSSKSLSYSFILAARRNWSKKSVCDTTGKQLTFGQALTAALALNEKIKQLTASQTNIGILLPPSVAAVMANLAVTLAGKTPVNLNYTASSQARAYAVDCCRIQTVIASKSFIGKVDDAASLPGLIFLEDIKQKISSSDKFKAYLKACLVPASLIANERSHNPDNIATIIFSSGSTGLPKGVMLSHYNILSNIEALRAVVQITPKDDMSGVVPFFHAMGFTCALWLPLVAGISASCITNPLDGKLVAQSVRENKTTIMFAPPTFLLSYLRRAEPQDFASLRLIACGAEKLKKHLSDAFEKKFNIKPYEGYGATELSPVVSLNIPDVQIDGEMHIGQKPNTVGNPLPGIAAKILDPQTLTPSLNGGPGLLMIKGPSVMVGYLNNDRQTKEVLQDGWYNTGDIATIDEDGFLTITGRLSRFSKIGGEMVPHGLIEEAYLNGLDTSDQHVVVVGIPDDKKGEQIVVFYLDHAADAEKLHQIISASDLPNIYKPKPENYIAIDAMPMLGSGKIDIMSLRKIAMASKNITIE